MAAAKRSIRADGRPTHDGNGETDGDDSWPEMRALAMFNRLTKLTTESIHYDFKLMCPIDTVAKKKEFARDVVAMYNGPGVRLEDTNGKPDSASYLVLGAKDGLISGRRELVPLVDRPEPYSYQQVLMQRAWPCIGVLYHDIWLDDDRDKVYGLVEIRKGVDGPAYVKPTAGEKGTEQSYTRLQDLTVPVACSDTDRTLWNQVLELFPKKYPIGCWGKIEPVLKTGARGAIHILVTNRLESRSTLSEPDIVSMVLGCFPWNVIIDLDHNSRSSGLLSKLRRHMTRKRDVISVTYKDVQGVLPMMGRVAQTQEGINTVMQTTVWILANGCAVDGVPKAKRRGQFLEPTFGFLTRLFSCVECPKPVVCISLVTSEEEIGRFPIILERLQDSYDSAGANMGYDALSFVTVLTEPRFVSHFSTAASADEADRSWSGAVTLPLLSFATGLRDCYKLETGIDVVLFPSSTGAPVSLLGADYAKMSQFLQLYHSEYGCIKEAAYVDDVYIDDVVIQFLRGRSITAEALYIQEKHLHQVFVPRTVVEHLTNAISSRLNRSPFYRRDASGNGARDRNTSNVFKLKHLSSAGGTTAGRCVLWSLRKQYPCIEVKAINDGLYSSLHHIFEKSGLPLLLLFDRSFDDIEVATVRKRMSNAVIKAVLLQVSKSTKKEFRTDMQTASGSSGSFSFCLNSTLEGMELGGFRRLYQVHIKQGSKTKVKMHATKTFLFGLYAFANEFQKITEHVTESVKHCTDIEKTILRLSAFLAAFTGKPLPIPLVARLLKLPVHTNPLTLVEKHLGQAAELLVTQTDGSANGKGTVNGVDLPHDCVIDTVWKKAMPGSSKSTTERAMIRQALADFLILAHDREMSQSRALKRVAHWLFQQRKGKNYSELVEKHHELFGKSETSKLMKEIADCFDDEPHFRAHYARYLMHQIGNWILACEEIERAIGKDVRPDPILLSIHGDLVRERLKRTIENVNSKEGEEPRSRVADEKALSCFLSLANQGVVAYGRAREHASETFLKAKVFAYTGEARLRVMLLKAAAGMNAPKMQEDPLLRDSENTTLEILSELNSLIDTQIIEDVDINQTRRLSFIARTGLFQLHHDSINFSPSYFRQTVTRDEEISSLPDIIRMRGRAPQKFRRWSELQYYELDIIVEKLMSRLKSEIAQFLTCDFDNLLNAMIAIRHVAYPQRERTDISLHLAGEVARQWIATYEHDHRPHFLLGIFSFVEAVQSKDPRPDLEHDSKSHLEHCRELCRKRHLHRQGRTEQYAQERTQHYASWKYYVGSEDGLAGVVPKDSWVTTELEATKEPVQLPNAKSFRGILQASGAYVSFLLAGQVPLSARVSLSPNASLFLRREQRPEVTFALAFSYKGILCYDVAEVS